MRNKPRGTKVDATIHSVIAWMHFGPVLAYAVPATACILYGLASISGAFYSSGAASFRSPRLSSFALYMERFTPHLPVGVHRRRLVTSDASLREHTAPADDTPVRAPVGPMAGSIWPRPLLSSLHILAGPVLDRADDALSPL